MRSLLLSTMIACLALFSALSTARAMTVAPMQVEMASIGTRSHAQVSVVNNSDQPLPIEAVIQRLNYDEAGRPKTSKAGEEFLVMPPQALIPPGATQNFRVQWLGDPMLRQSQSFLLYMNQIPVKLQPGKSGVQVVMSMGVVVNVAPAEGTPDLRVVATGIAADKAGNRVPTITVENTSNVHALLPEAAIHLSAPNWSQTLPSRSIGDHIGIGLVMPGKRRKFALPVPLPAGVVSVDASLEMPPARR